MYQLKTTPHQTTPMHFETSPRHFETSRAAGGGGRADGAGCRNLGRSGRTTTRSGLQRCWASARALSTAVAPPRRRLSGIARYGCLPRPIAPLHLLCWVTEARAYLTANGTKTRGPFWVMAHGMDAPSMEMILRSMAACLALAGSSPARIRGISASE